MTKNKRMTEKGIVEISRQCARILDEKKARDTVIMDLRKVNSYLDYFIVTTGNSRIHCRALAKELENFIRGQGMRERCRPEFDSGWIILDFSEIIVHIFTEEMREYYQLEKLWGDARRISYAVGEE